MSAGRKSGRASHWSRRPLSSGELGMPGAVTDLTSEFKFNGSGFTVTQCRRRAVRPGAGHPPESDAADDDNGSTVNGCQVGTRSYDASAPCTIIGIVP
eukprot:222679-Hanusia_phi.AAC.2